MNQIQRFQDYLEQSYDSTDENTIIDRLQYLSILNVKSGAMLADIKGQRDKAIRDAYLSVLNDPLFASEQASVINKYCEASAFELTKQVVWLERINSGAVHQMEALRSILSYRKEQMKL